MRKKIRLIAKATPVYTISVASRITNLPIHTLRWLEANRLIEPSRTGGQHRLFSDENIELLHEIAILLQRDVNVAGIRTILLMKKTYNIKRLELEEDISAEERESNPLL